MVRDRLASPAVTARDERIDENLVGETSERFGLTQVGDHRRNRVLATDPKSTDESEVAESDEVFGGFLPMKLDNPDFDAIGESRHLIGGAVDEQADSLGCAR